MKIPFFLDCNSRGTKWWHSLHSRWGKKKNLPGISSVILICFVFSCSILSTVNNETHLCQGVITKVTVQAVHLTVYGYIAACNAEFSHPPAAEQSLYTPVQNRLWLYATRRYLLSLKKGHKKTPAQSREFKFSYNSIVVDLWQVV